MPSALNVTQFVWLLLVAFVVALFAQRRKLPYPLALVCTGLGIGATGIFPEAHLDPHTLFTLFLPPLLFESAIHLKASALKEEAKPILTLSLAGTVLSTFLIGYLVSWLLHLPLIPALVFGALISPTDPISVIAMLRRLNVSPRLSLIVEAESLFNDGVAVVLFTILLGLASGQGPSPWMEAGRFMVVLLGGILVGGGIGWTASRVAKRSDDHLLDLTLTTLVAFGSYLTAETLHVSGVIAVVSAGLVLGNDGLHTGMSAKSRQMVLSFWEYAAFVVNSIVFLLIGLEADFIHWWEHPKSVLLGIGIVLIGRAAPVYGLSALLKLVHVELSASWQHLLVWGGLRGALCLALALGLPIELPGRERILAVTFGYVLFSLLVQGLTVGKLIERLGISGPPRAPLES